MESTLQQLAYSCVSDSPHVLHNSHRAHNEWTQSTFLRMEPLELTGILLWHFCDCLELCSSLFMQNSLAVWVFTEIILAQLSFPCVKRLLCYCQVTQLIICTKEKLYSTQVWLWLVKHWFATPHILGSAQLRCFMYAVISIKNMTLYYAITFQAVKTWKSTWGESVQVIFRSHITTSPL